jgi:hypothetical protein
MVTPSGLLPSGSVTQQASSSTMGAVSGLVPSAGTGHAEYEVPFSDWEIDPKDIEIMKRPDGSEWELGAGGFGKVYKALRNGVQPVAVKLLTVG